MTPSRQQSRVASPSFGGEPRCPSRKGSATTLSVAVALLLFVMCPSRVTGSLSLELITEDEAKLPAAPEEEPSVELRTAGPRIVIRSPIDGGDYESSVDVDVEFAPGPSGFSVKEDTLRVTYLKIVPIDLTDKVRPYFQNDRLHVEGVKVPTGRHRLRMTIADVGGYSSMATLSFSVH